MHCVGVLAELREYTFQPPPQPDPEKERLRADRAELIAYHKAILKSPSVLMEIHDRIERAIRRMERQP